MSDPFLWIGNEELVSFSGNKIFDWINKEEKNEKLPYLGSA